MCSRKKINERRRVRTDTIKSLVKDLQIALLQADVNVRMVKRLTNNIKNSVSNRDMQSQLNTRKMIKKAVFDELVKMLDPDKKPYVPKKGSQGKQENVETASYECSQRREGTKISI